MNASKCLRVVSRTEATSWPILRPSILRDTTPPSRFLRPQQRCLSLLSPRGPWCPRTSSAPSPSPRIFAPTSTIPIANPSSTVIQTLMVVGKISPHRSFSTTPALCAPRDTYNPSHIVRKRRHGFLSRIRTKKGRKLLMRRIKRGRWNLSH